MSGAADRDESPAVPETAYMDSVSASGMHVVFGTVDSLLDNPDDEALLPFQLGRQGCQEEALLTPQLPSVSSSSARDNRKRPLDESDLDNDSKRQAKVERNMDRVQVDNGTDLTKTGAKVIRSTVQAKANGTNETVSNNQAEQETDTKPIQDQDTLGNDKREIRPSADACDLQKGSSQACGANMLYAGIDNNAKDQADANLNNDDDDELEGSDTSNGDESDEGSYYSDDVESEGASLSSNDAELGEGCDSSEGDASEVDELEGESFSSDDDEWMAGCDTSEGDVSDEGSYYSFKYKSLYSDRDAYERRWRFDEPTELRLLRNDPAVTNLTLWQEDQHEMDDYLQRVGLAINRSTNLQEVGIEMCMFPDTALNGGVKNDGLHLWVVNIIGCFPSLRMLSLLHWDDEEIDPAGFRVATVAFFTAVRGRTALGQKPLQEVEVSGVALEVKDLSDLIRDGQLERFKISTCQMLSDSFATRAHAVRHIEEIFAASTTLRDVSIAVHEEFQDYACAIMSGLQTTGLTKLGICIDDPGNPVLIVAAVASFIDVATCPLTHLLLEFFDWTGDSFAPLAASLTNTSKKIELSFEYGSMDHGMCALLQSVLSADGNTISLCLREGINFPEANDYEAVKMLVGSSPGLKNFSLQNNDEAVVCAVIEGLNSVTCGIQRVELQGSLPNILLGMLVDAIPSMGSVKTLSLDCPSHLKQHFLASVRRNRTLHSLTVSPAESFEPTDFERLHAYTERNRLLPVVIRKKSPTQNHENGHPTVSKHLPSLLCLSNPRPPIDSTYLTDVTNVVAGLLTLDAPTTVRAP